MTHNRARHPTPGSRLLPLYGAGFVTAFGAHSIAASLGGYTVHQHASLLTLGILLAVYDGAEVLLKPLFGSLADRIGAKPVLVGGLVAFTIASAGFVLAGNPALVGVARLGQGAGAAAFSPAVGALLARLTASSTYGRAFGSYGAWKGLGYTLGPVLGGVLITVGGYPLLFSILAALALIVAAGAAVMVPGLPPLPRTRQTVLDLARRLASGNFLRPTLALAGGTAALAAGVGFLPVIGAGYGLGPLAAGATVSVLDASAAVIQPWVGRARDAGRIRDGVGMAAGLLLAATGGASAALLAGLAGLLAAAVAIGAGIALITPIGFAHLAATTPAGRLGQTLGSAEIGRELGDAGGPLLVGAIATASTASLGMAGLAIALALTALAVVTTPTTTSVASQPDPMEAPKQ
jgi:MFS transporter, DHA1 family, tetracycline resistance protein